MTVTGVADVNRILREIAPNEAKNLLRATVYDMAGQAAKAARADAPDDTGLLQSAIGHKRERGTRTTIAASVVVARSAFYWRFLEYGQGPDRVEHAFFLKALTAMKSQMERLYLKTFVAKLEKRLARLARRG